MLIWPLLLSCTQEAAPPLAAVDTGDPATPVVSLDPPQAAWTPAEAIAAVEGLVATGFPLPHAALDTYLGLMAQGDSTCPGDSHQITDKWLRGCTAETGYSYAGVSVFTEQDHGPEGHSWELGGDFEIITDAGVSMSVGGHALYGWGLFEGGRHWSGQVTGAWDYPGGPPWMAGGASMWLKLDGGQSEANDWVIIDGSVGLAEVDVNFVEVAFDRVSCAFAPRGTLEIRDPTGYWYTLTFDCGTCGAMAFHGEDLGEHCLDLTPLAAALSDAMAPPP